MDGTLEINKTDGTYTTGYFGLNVFGVQARYDDVTISNEAEIHYVRDVNGDVLAEYDFAGNLLAEYVYANGQRIAKMTAGGSEDIYLNDHLGSARAMTESGWSANYYPFGEVASQTGSNFDTRFDFTGQERDQGTRLMYFGARYYDASIGRFLSVDRFAYKYPSLTPYQYTANSPVNFIDVNGDSIWINYLDAEGNSQRLQYTTGLTYNGDNADVAALVNSLNTMSSVQIGNEVLTKLIGSEGDYTVNFGQASDPGAGGQFLGNASGPGGTFTLNSSQLGVEKIAHEFFHGFQHELGSGGGSILSEVESSIYGAAVALGTGNTSIGTSGIGGRAGNIYQSMGLKAVFASSFVEAQAYFYSAVSTFSKGSFANSRGLYSRHGFPRRAANQRVIIK